MHGHVGWKKILHVRLSITSFKAFVPWFFLENDENSCILIHCPEANKIIILLDMNNLRHFPMKNATYKRAEIHETIFWTEFCIAAVFRYRYKSLFLHPFSLINIMPALSIPKITNISMKVNIKHLNIFKIIINVIFSLVQLIFTIK